jgi:ferritin-like metal-binding protein YciE
MTTTLELSDELHERIESHLEEGESPEEFIEELVSMYETEGAFLREGYSE